jgi:hypothetical protein
MSDDELRQAAAIIRRLLEQVEEGQVDVGGARGVAVVRRLEGAAQALETASETA